MNQSTNINYARLSSKFATFFAVVLAVILVGCRESTPPAKVVEVKPFTRETNGALKIVAIEDNGVVYLGKYPGFHAGAICWIDNHVFRLVGRAQVGDQAILVWNYEDQLFDNGKVKRVLKSVGVKSANHRVYEEYFTPTGSYDEYDYGYDQYEPMVEDKPPGTK